MTANAAVALRTISHPRNLDACVQVFADLDAARRHIRDHLLTAPECEGWAALAPKFREIVDVQDADRRWNCARQLDDAAVFEPLYAFYHEVLAAEAADAAKLGWLAPPQPGRLTVTLGTSGVLLMIEERGRPQRAVVVTAFLPGQGSAEAVVEAKAQPKETLLRERSRSSDRAIVGRSLRRRRKDSLDKRQWTPEERLYYRAFRPSVQFIRRQYPRSRDFRGRPTGNDYALLKQVLPPHSRLKYQNWLELRRQCRGAFPGN